MRTLLTVTVLGLALSGCQLGTPDVSDRSSALRVAASRPGGHWPVIQTRRIDLDGDGSRDVVRLRKRGGEWGSGPVRIEAVLGPDRMAVGIVRRPGIDAMLLRRGVDLDADGDREVVLWRDMGPREIAVLDLVGDRIRPARHPDHPPLASTYTPNRHARAWWPGRLHLFSTRSVRSFGGTSHYVVTPDRYAVRVWRWSLEGRALVAEDLGRRCVRATAPQEPEPC